MAYRNPVLKEVICTFLFEDGKVSDGNLLDLASTVKNSGFPEVESGQEMAITQVTQDNGIPKGVAVQASFQPMMLLKCWSEDKKSVVQMTRYRVTVNFAGEYPGWDNFSNLFKKIYELFKPVQMDQHVREVNLETIDEFKGSSQYVIGEYLNCNGKFVPSFYKDVKTASDINIGSGYVHTDGKNIGLNFKIRYTENELIAAVHSTFKLKLTKPEDAIKTLESLHEQSTEVFNDWTTVRVKNEVMGGVK